MFVHFRFEVETAISAGEPVVDICCLQRALPSASLFEHNECDHCEKPAAADTSVKMKRCTACLSVAYCGKYVSSVVVLIVGVGLIVVVVLIVVVGLIVVVVLIEVVVIVW